MSADLQRNTSGTCPSCGRPLSAGAKFCRGCGSPVGQPPPTETVATCPSCGAARTAGVKFCRACGFRFGVTAGPAISGEHLPRPGTEPQVPKAQESAPTVGAAPLATPESIEPAATAVPRKVCPSCGTEQATPKAFCRNCGSPLVPVGAKTSARTAWASTTMEGVPSATTSVPKEAPAVVRCATCGTEVPPGKKFCRSCGAPVGVPPPSAREQVIPRVSPQAVPTQAAAFPSVASSATRAVSEPTAPVAAEPAGGPATAPGLLARWSTARVAAVVLGCVALLGGGGFLAYRHFGANRQSAPAARGGSQTPATVGPTSSGQPLSSPAPLATPTATVPPQTGQTRAPSSGASGNPANSGASVQGGTAPLPPTSRPVPTPPPGLTTPVNNPAGSGLGAAGGVASPASPAAGASGYPSAGIAVPANNRSGGAGAGVAAPAIVNPSPATAPPTKPAAGTVASPPAPPQQVQPAVPSSGTLVWSGHLDKNALVTIRGRSASSGTLEGQLPGVPVIIQVYPNNIGVAEFPGPQNSWKKVVLRGNKSGDVVVRIQWQTLQQ
jgi:Double zinc ribbon